MFADQGGREALNSARTQGIEVGKDADGFFYFVGTTVDRQVVIAVILVD